MKYSDGYGGRGGVKMERLEELVGDCCGHKQAKLGYDRSQFVNENVRSRQCDPVTMEHPSVMLFVDI